MSATVATNSGSSTGRLLAAVAVVAMVVVAALALRPRSVPQPTLIGARQSAPTAIKRSKGVWFWIEQSKTQGAQLVRTMPSGVVAVATAETIDAFSVNDGRIAWAERRGQRWTVQLAQVDGNAKLSLWSGDTEPMGIALGEGRVYWLQRVPAPVADGDPFPPLMDTLELHSVPVSGGTPATVCRLWEAQDGTVLGARNGTVSVAVYRHTRPGNLALYRITSDGAAPVRVAGEQANPGAVLSHDGVLYWLAPSTEAYAAYCVRRLRADGTIETLSDWLPNTVTLFDTERGVVCIDQNPAENLWYSGPREVFPVPFVVPNGYVVLAAGEHDVLLARAEGVRTAPTLYGMPVP